MVINVLQIFIKKNIFQLFNKRKFSETESLLMIVAAISKSLNSLNTVCTVMVHIGFVFRVCNLEIRPSHHQSYSE